MTLIEGVVGSGQNGKMGDGSPVPARLSYDGALIANPGHGRYQEAVQRGNVYTGHNVAAQAVSVALATTYTGLCLSNPVSSSQILVLLGCNYALSVAPAAIASLHLIGGYSPSTDVTHTTPLASPGIRNAMLGNSDVGVAKLDSAATIVNPGYLLSLGSGFTAAALYATTPGWIDLGGCIILRPGAWVAFGALTAVTGFGSFIWEEIPV